MQQESLRENIEKLSSEFNLISLLKDADKDIQKLTEELKALYNKNYHRNMQRIKESCFFLIDDEAGRVSLNRDYLKEIYESLGSFMGFESNRSELSSQVSSLQKRLATKEAEIASLKTNIDRLNREKSESDITKVEELYEKIKALLFSNNPDREASITIRNEEGKEPLKEEIRVYPYFPKIVDESDYKRGPILSNPKLLDGENIERENIKSGAGIFKRVRKLFGKEAKNEKPQNDLEKRNEAVKRILLDRSISNETKMAQYSVIAGLDAKKYQLLLTAASNGIDAETIITFLEEPDEIFSYEVISEYVSIAGNKNSRNIKLQLARDLVDGKWTIEGSDGKKYQVFPVELINSIRKRFGESI